MPETGESDTRSDLRVLETEFRGCQAASETRADGILEKLDLQTGAIDSLTRAIRGENGDPGLVGRLCTIRKAQAWLWAVMVIILGGVVAVAFK